MRRLTALVFALFACVSCSEPPHKEIDRAQGAVETARAAGADRYAPAEFAAATTSLQQANDAVAARDYRLALLRALDAFERALQAARQGADGKARARSDAEVALTRSSGGVQRLERAVKEDGLAAAARGDARRRAQDRSRRRKQRCKRRAH